MPSCRKCGAYTKFYGKLCKKCYYSSRSKSTSGTIVKMVGKALFGTKNPVKPKIVYKNRFEKRTRPTPTLEQRKLYYALKERGIPAKLEHWDGHKHIDIAIPKAKFNIEVDGTQHNWNQRQASSDLSRTFYSDIKGYETKHVPNSLVRGKYFSKTVDMLVELINRRL